MRRIIGFSGQMGAGKDYAANILAGYEQTKFAAALKDMMRALYRAAGVDEETIERKIEGDLKELPCEVLGGKTPRYAMQTLGTEWGRCMIHTDLWTNIWKARVETLGDFVTATDVRYDNEAKAVREMGGIVVKIVDDTKPKPTSDQASHESEKLELKADVVVHNDKTMHFIEKVRALTKLPRDIRQQLDRDAA